MGGKSIDKHEMAKLVYLVLDKDVRIKDAVKKFDFLPSAASRSVKAARDGKFDYRRYLDADDRPPDDSNESDDRSIFAVADMIDTAVTQSMADHLDELKKMVEKTGTENVKLKTMIEAGGNRQKIFEDNVKNKVDGLEKKYDKALREKIA